MAGDLKKFSVICFIFLFFSLKLSAPDVKFIIIMEATPSEPFNKLASAVAMVETGSDTLAYNPLEQAAGIYQIRPIRLIEYNRQTGSRLSRKDLFDYNTSRKIFLYFADQIGPYNLELIARRWNGSGKLTTNYWNRIKHYL